MNRLNRLFSVLIEFFSCFAFGSLLIYGPLWITWWSAISHFDLQVVRGFGHLLIIFIIPCLHDLFTRAAYTFLMIGFVFSPVIEILTSRMIGWGNHENAIEMLFTSFISTFFIFLANAAEQKGREFYGPDWNWQFPSNFKKSSY